MRRASSTATAVLLLKPELSTRSGQLGRTCVNFRMTASSFGSSNSKPKTFAPNLEAWTLK
jgi:hypothetical protein